MGALATLNNHTQNEFKPYPSITNPQLLCPKKYWMDEQQRAQLYRRHFFHF